MGSHNTDCIARASNEIKLTFLDSPKKSKLKKLQREKRALASQGRMTILFLVAHKCWALQNYQMHACKFGEEKDKTSCQQYTTILMVYMYLSG